MFQTIFGVLTPAITGIQAVAVLGAGIALGIALWDGIEGKSAAKYLTWRTETWYKGLRVWMI